jgi:hypothetical protein
MLAREFRRRQAQPCRACYIVPPYASAERGVSGANWTLDMPVDCGGDCRGIIEDLVAEYSLRYDLR